MTTWFLIADGSRARLFARDDEGALSLVQEFDHPEGRAHPGDLSLDQGRTRQTGSATFASERDERAARWKQEMARFAKRLAGTLEQGAVGGRFDELVLVVPPQFLGLLRSKLHPKVEERILTTLTKDLTDLSEHELKQREGLFDLYPPT